MKKVNYRKLITQPAANLPGIFNIIYQRYISGVVDQSATAAQTSVLVTYEIKHLAGKVLTTQQIDKISDIANAFDLSYLYSRSRYLMETTE